MNRFFLDADQITPDGVTFPADIAHQVRHVLRLKEGDQVVVLDNRGLIYHVRLQIDSREDKIRGEIISKKPAHGEPEMKIALYFGLTSREKVEWILQKGTEIGVSTFSPYVSSRTLVQSTKLSDHRRERWEKIIKEAAEQSHRAKLPVLNAPIDLLEAFSAVKKEKGLCLIAWEDVGSAGNDIRAVLEAYEGKDVALFIGPEGGFSEDEINSALSFGCQVVSLGERILRMETAALVLPAIVLYELGDL